MRGKPRTPPLNSCAATDDALGCPAENAVTRCVPAQARTNDCFSVRRGPRSPFQTACECHNSTRHVAAMDRMISPAISVVVVAYNSAAWLPRCLAPILAQADDIDGLEIIVVDNASPDASGAIVRQAFPSVRVIDSPQNIGFGAGCNLALAQASGHTLVMVNPDCEIRPGTLRAFADHFRTHPTSGAAGGRLCYGDGSFQDAAFRFPSLAQVVLDFWPISWRLTQSRINGRYPRALDSTAFPCDFVLGALMAVRREAYESTGGFDPAYFMYVEEVDWCRRLGAQGWEVWHLPGAVATHHAGQSTRTVAARMFVELHRSRLRYYRRHWSPMAVAAARAITWLGCRSRARRLAQGGMPDRTAHVDACHEVLRMVATGGTGDHRADD
jgi:N-acetylglucosaminyl-diphospho-decaprenol L-rhamnosyltransferase